MHGLVTSSGAAVTTARTGGTYEGLFYRPTVLADVPTAERLGANWTEFVAARAKQIPVARAGQPDDIAHTVSFLVSNGAGFVSGQVIYVAGGPKA